MSASAQAADIASKGLGFIWSATVAGASGLSDALSKAKKHYVDYREKDQLESMRKQGKHPSEILLGGTCGRTFLLLGFKCCVSQFVAAMFSPSSKEVPLLESSGV